jgi:hypothetical protein
MPVFAQSWFAVSLDQLAPAPFLFQSGQRKSELQQHWTIQPAAKTLKTKVWHLLMGVSGNNPI